MMDSLSTIDASDPSLEEILSSLQAPTHITANDGELDLIDAPSSPSSGIMFTGAAPLSASSSRSTFDQGLLVPHTALMESLTPMWMMDVSECSLIAFLRGYNVSRLTRYNRYITPRFHFRS